MSLDKYFLPHSQSQSLQKENDNNNPSTSKHNNILMDLEEDELSDSNEGLKCKRVKRNKFKQKFKKTWLNEGNSSWLTEIDGTTRCRVCNNKLIVGGITHINRHAKSISHLQKIRTSQSTPKVSSFIKEGNEMKRLKEGVKEGEIKIIMFLADHNLSFALLDHFTKLISSVCFDSEIAKNLKVGRKKGSAICKDITGPENLDNISADLKKSWFSIIIDESTDISTTKCLAMTARYYKDTDTSVKDRFLGLLKVDSCDAEGLFNATKQFLLKINVPLSQIIGFAADNASVMQGKMNSVQSRFKEEIPEIYVLGCVCHSLALCSTAACKKLPTSVETLARDIVFYFSHSSKRLDEFKEFQKFLETPQHKLLKLSQTRWLSLQAVVERILEQWQPLTLFFTNEVYDKGSAINPQNILKALQQPVFQLYFSFLGYILDIINKMNKEFQSESPKIHLLDSRISSLFKSILKNFIKNEYLNKQLTYDNLNFHPHNYKAINDIYVGANCEIIMNSSNIDNIEVEGFKLKCLDFYIELAKQIQSRFNFNDPVLKFLKNLDPAVGISGNCQSLVPIATRFTKLYNNIEKLNSEWRLLSDIEVLKKHADTPLVEFWSKIFNMKNELNEYMFPEVSSFVKGMLSLPHSSAAVERIFSHLSLIKTKNRNRHHISTCDSLLHTKFLLGKDKCFEFKPSRSLMARNIKTQNTEEVDDVDLTF